MKHLLMLSGLVLIAMHGYSQILNGKIIKVDGEPVPVANLVIRDSITSSAIKEFAIIRNGEFKISLKKPYTTLVVEVSAKGFMKEIWMIANVIVDKEYSHTFRLSKDTITVLKEVVVKAKAPAFKIRGDTTTFNVASYSNGSERKIQDVIKKLPGVTVNDKTGEIKYLGRSIETVKLDGEDLFGSNYTIGTRNINVDLVDQVEAIENYSANPLLKGIEQDGKVALNLKLKKNKINNSGDVGSGAGVIGSGLAYDFSLNLLSISKRYKSFGTASANNIGANYSPFDYFSYNPSVEQIKEEEFLAKKYIPESFINSSLNDERRNINQALFSSYNAVFKIGQRISLKSNLYHIKDKILATEFSETRNLIDNIEFTTSDQSLSAKKPVQYRGDLEVKYNLSRSTLVEYAFKYKNETIKTSQDVIQNKADHFTSLLQSDNVFVRQSLINTTRLSHKKAFRFSVLYSVDRVPQTKIFLPAVSEGGIYDTNEQFSRFIKRTYDFQASILGKTGEARYSIVAGSQIQKTFYNSDLKGIKNNNISTIEGFRNDMSYYKDYHFISGIIRFKAGKFHLNPTLLLNFLNQSLNDSANKNNQEKQNFLVVPGITVRYKLNNSSAILLGAKYDQRAFSEEFLISNPVFVSTRSIKANEVELRIQKTKSLLATYLINDLYRQFQLNVNIAYSEINGNYFYNYLIREDRTHSLMFYLPEKSDNISGNFTIEKYINFLKGTVRMKNIYSWSTYKNIVNSSELRSNRSQNLQNELFYKTAFESKINFENNFILNCIKTKAEQERELSFNSINNHFQIFFKPVKRLFTGLSSTYIVPDVNMRNTSYHFIDGNISYEDKKGIYSFSIKARNLLNRKFQREIIATDFSKTWYQSNLLPLHILVGIGVSL